MRGEAARVGRAAAHFEWKRGAVLVMDALGMKGSWARASPGELVASWKEVIHSAEASVNSFRKSLSEKSRRTDCGERDGSLGPQFRDCALQALSDTLVVVVQAKKEDRRLWYALDWLVAMAMGIFVTALNRGIYFRGVISCGEFFGSPDEKLMIGPAVDEAVDWYTKPDWIGVSTAPSAFFQAERESRLRPPYAGPTNLLSKWRVPMRNGETTDSWVLDWPGCGALGLRPPDEKRLLALFAGKPIGHDALSKYANTLAFFRTRMAEQERQAEVAAPPAR